MLFHLQGTGWMAPSHYCSIFHSKLGGGLHIVGWTIYLLEGISASLLALLEATKLSYLLGFQAVFAYKALTLSWSLGK